MSDRDLVVIGGSLGSIEPLKAMLRALPPDFPAAILVVVHVPSTSTGVFASVSAAGSVLPVKTAEDGDRIERGHVYLAPPNRHLLVAEGHLKLGLGPRGSPGNRSAVQVGGSDAGVPGHRRHPEWHAQ